jgi:hypothetical protein
MLPSNQHHAPDDLSAGQPRPATREKAFALITLATAVLYLGAATLHWGVRIPVGPMVLAFPAAIRPATIVEAAIGVALASGAVAVLAQARRASTIARIAYIFALIGTLFGLTIVLLRRLPAPDIWVHVAMLAGLAAGYPLLPRTRARRSG